MLRQMKRLRLLHFTKTNMHEIDCGLKKMNNMDYGLKETGEMDYGLKK